MKINEITFCICRKAPFIFLDKFIKASGAMKLRFCDFTTVRDFGLLTQVFFAHLSF